MWLRGRGFRACLVGLSLVATAATASPHASAQQPATNDVEVAKRAFEDGVSLEKKNDYAGALAKFRESAQIKATLGNRFHIAYCLEMLGQLAAALNEYEGVDKTAREQNKPELIEATRVRLEPLRPRVPQVAFRVMPPPPKEGIAGMEVLVDGKAVATLDKGQRVDPGDHVVTAHAPDHESFTKKINVTEGASITVDVLLPARAQPAPQNAPSGPNNNAVGSASASTPDTTPARSHTLAIATTAGAVALTAVGIVTFVLAGSAQSDAEASCPTKTSCSDEQSKVRTLDAVSLAGLIGGVGLGALSVVLWVSPSSSASASAPRPSVKLVARPSWLGLERRF